MMVEGINYDIIGQTADLAAHEKVLIDAAVAALPYSYAPYSRFRVAAAIYLDNDGIITGVNQENAASPSGLCAEQTALYRKGISDPDALIKQIVIIARNAEGKPVAVSPCGSCRQVMLEFVHRQEVSFPVLMQHEDSKWLRVKAAEDLLPFGFTAKSR